MSNFRTDILEQARKLRPVIEQAAESLPDVTASTAPTLFPALKQDGALVKAGTRINWGGIIKRAAVDLWDTADNDPDHAPALWEDIGYRAGFRIAPDPFASTNAAAMNNLEHVAQGQVCSQDQVPGVEVLRQRVLLAPAI